MDKCHRHRSSLVNKIRLSSNQFTQTLVNYIVRIWRIYLKTEPIMLFNLVKDSNFFINSVTYKTRWNWILLLKQCFPFFVLNFTTGVRK